MGSTTTVGTWLKANAHAVGPDDLRLLEQAAILFEGANVHLRQREARGVDPVFALQRLRASPPADRAGLYRDLMAIFARFGDRHTRCILPPAWDRQFAYLPLTVAECWQDGACEMIVTGSADPRLRPGDRLDTWNDRPVSEIVEAHEAGQLGANPAARRAKSLQTLTVRPLALLPPPEGAVKLTGSRGSVHLEWRMADMAQLGRDLAACIAPEPDFEDAAAGLGVRRVSTSAGPIGWIKITSLRVPADAFLPALAAALEHQPSLGVVLDLRGCEEGFVQTGEAMLRLFTDRPIEPLQFELRATEWMRDLVRASAAMADWRGPVETAAAAGRGYSLGRPLTAEAAFETGLKPYRGRLIVLVDALTYSTAEMFAAGVQDHRIGTVIGVAPSTGGGGGSAWSHELIHRLSGDAFLAPAADAPRLRMAVLRCRRTGANAGRLIECEGVVPDLIHLPTRRDRLESDSDLIDVIVQRMEACP
ncbi:S41 family peptidase [Sphingomonas sp. HF-S3]|uniref:S41 family peptidase n=1 Tax=Sphingomonas rustica TaxID=3103142 RepID=A0ABV0B777_9SPHN